MPVFLGGHRIPVRPSFRDPRFVFLLVGQSAGWVCSWAASLVLWGFAAYHFGADPAGISVTALCWSGPPVVLTAFTGGLTDRFGPRTMLIIGYTCSAATSLGMSVSGSLTSLDIMALACGAARSLCSPASSALPTRIVESDDLLAANSLLGVTSSIGQVAGPLAASVLMAATGFRIAFTTDAAMYLVGALVLIPLPVLPLPEEPRNAGAMAIRRPAYGLSWWRAAAAGAVAVAREPGLRAIALARMGVIFTSGAFLVIEPLYTRHVLHRPSSQFALFEAATGIGAVAATTLQRLAPAGKLGRVSGVISTAESTMESLSMPVAGALVAVAGLRPGALVLASIAVAAGAVCLLG
jgi:MFS family permease